MLNLMEFTTEEQWILGITTVAKNVAQKVWTKENRDFFLSLTGGHTPKPLYLAWAQDAFFGKGISWWLGDERCVELEDDARNEKMLKATLGKAPWFTDNFMSWGDATNPDRAAKIYEAALFKKLDKVNHCFDVIILGIGPDGHIASLFPNSPEIFITESLCVATQEKHMGHRRVSLTLPIINKAKHVFFLVRGPEKKPIIDLMRRSSQDIPAGRIRVPEQTLFWLQNHPI